MAVALVSLAAGTASAGDLPPASSDVQADTIAGAAGVPEAGITARGDAAADVWPRLLQLETALDGYRAENEILRQEL